MTRGRHAAGKHRGRGRHAKGPIAQWFADFTAGNPSYEGKRRKRTNYGDAT